MTLASFPDAVFHSGPAGFGLLGSVVAIGSVVVARPVAYTVALVPVGVATLLFLRCACNWQPPMRSGSG